MASQRIEVIDSHTGGEPTRLILSGGPSLEGDTLSARVADFRKRFDTFRSVLVNEPRASPAVVGALLCPTVEPRHAAAVIFFNNSGYLGMCGHGTIGLLVSLAHTGRIKPGHHTVETPVGSVHAMLHDDARFVSFENVPAFRHAHAISVDVPDFGSVTGDVAWGGNWFFLVDNSPIPLEAARIPELLAFTHAIRRALDTAGVRAADGACIDHIEISSSPVTPGTHSRNFVLCPGGAYDRSPCGTGTSARLACLHASGALAPGEVWRQEGIIGSVFETSYRLDRDGRIIPRITGSAFVTAEATVILDNADPFPAGIPAA